MRTQALEGELTHPSVALGAIVVVGAISGAFVARSYQNYQKNDEFRTAWRGSRNETTQVIFDDDRANIFKSHTRPVYYRQ